MPYYNGSIKLTMRKQNMGRFKISKENKAKPYSFSLFPKHIEMINKICQDKKIKSSDFLQNLVEKEYNLLYISK